MDCNKLHRKTLAPDRKKTPPESIKSHDRSDSSMRNHCLTLISVLLMIFFYFESLRTLITWHAIVMPCFQLFQAMLRSKKSKRASTPFSVQHKKIDVAFGLFLPHFLCSLLTDSFSSFLLDAGTLPGTLSGFFSHIITSFRNTRRQSLPYNFNIISNSTIFCCWQF